MPYDYEWAEQESAEFHQALTRYINLESRKNDSGDLNETHSWLVAHQRVPRRIAKDVLTEPIPRFASDPMHRMTTAC